MSGVAGILQQLFANVYPLFRLNFPGTSISILMIMLSCLATCFVIKIASKFLGELSGLGGGTFRGPSQRGGQSGTQRIASNRQGDQK